ncbi:MAG: hypothetical protein KDG54_16430 [Geminicoccaceae bacterium]|nr:hypothetical protein [Geminicoccaceae bacterium]
MGSPALSNVESSRVNVVTCWLARAEGWMAPMPPASRTTVGSASMGMSPSAWRRWIAALRSNASISPLIRSPFAVSAL